MASFFKPPPFLMRNRAAKRVRVPESRQVVCYRCAKSLTVSGYAESSSCPHCNGSLRLIAYDITNGHWGSSIMTTESVRVHPEAQVIANVIVASGDIVIEGSVKAMCICGGTAHVTATGELRGGIRAGCLVVEAGATLEGTIIEAPSRALGRVDVENAARARPGTGAAAQIECKPFRDPLAPPPAEEATILITNPTHPRLRVVR